MTTTRLSRGTPLVPVEVARQASGAVRTDTGLVLDRRLREANFNLEDGLTDSRALWLRSRIEAKLNSQWTLANELSVYDANRRWRNSENYTFNRATGLLDRGTTRIDHDHRFWMERVALSGESAIGGKRLRLSSGVEYGRNDFGNPRRFGTASSIDPYGAVRGFFPTLENAASFPGAGNRVDFDSTLTNSALFAEGALNLAPRWLWVAGLRYETHRHRSHDRGFQCRDVQQVLAPIRACVFSRRRRLRHRAANAGVRANTAPRSPRSEASCSCRSPIRALRCRG